MLIHSHAQAIQKHFPQKYPGKPRSGKCRGIKIMSHFQFSFPAKQRLFFVSVSHETYQKFQNPNPVFPELALRFIWFLVRIKNNKKVKCRLVVSSLLDVGQLLDGLGDDVETLLELLLGDDQGGSEADNVAVRRLGQETLALEEEAEIPGSSAVGGRLVDDNGVQETLSTDDLEDRGVEGLEALSEGVAKLLGLGCEVLLLHDLEGSDGDGASERVTAVG